MNLRSGWVVLAAMSVIEPVSSRAVRADAAIAIADWGIAGAASGPSRRHAAELAVEEINQTGPLIDGKKVSLKLVSEDDAGDPRAATQVAQKLVDSHVSAVIGHINSGCSIPASKIYNDAGIPELSPASSNPVYTAQGYKTAYLDKFPGYYNTGSHYFGVG